METGDPWATLTILTGGIATLGIYTFLIGENPAYRFFENLFIGIAAGFLPIFTIKNLLWPKIITPMFGLDVVKFPDGTPAVEYQPLSLLYLIPMLFGLLYYCLYSKRHAWLAKLVIGFSLGASAGLAFKGFFAKMIPQLSSSFKSLIVLSPEGVDYVKSFNNTFFVFTLLVVMYYFFFTLRFKSTESTVISGAARWLMMICFGAFFGSTVMARLALLVERLQFLIGEWLPEVERIFA